MNALAAVLADACALAAVTVDRTGYGMAYGSHAALPAGGDSDLDLLFIGPALPAARLDALISEVVDLHRRHRLRIDTEVAYEVKLHAQPAEADQAFALCGFNLGADGTLHVPPVIAEPEFLNSHPFKLRLILNAHTSPHLFLGGDLRAYERQLARAEQAAALLALSILDAEILTVADAVAALTTAADGATGPDFLGYTASAHLHSMVNRGLARLASLGVIEPVDERRLRQHRARRRHLVAERYKSAMDAAGVDATMALEPEGGSQL